MKAFLLGLADLPKEACGEHMETFVENLQQEPHR